MVAIDVGSIPGVTSAVAARLNAVGLFSSSDLLRTNRRVLVSRVQGTTVEAVRRWQAFSRLLEIDGLTPESVAALVLAGIDRLEEFSGKPLAALKTALAEISPLPTDDELVQALLAARRLEFTGVLNGTVVNSAGAPLEGATAVVQGQSATSDARGRFRVVGLPLGATYTLTLSHPARRTKVFQRVSVHASAALVGRTFRLTGKPAAAHRLSSLAGDVLPPLGSAPITTEAQSTDYSERDKFTLIDRYANGDGRIASRFLDFSQGRFVVRTYRVPKVALPAGVKPRDGLAVSSGALVLAEVSASDVRRQTRIQAVLERYADKQPTPELVDEAAAAMFRAISNRKSRTA